MVHIYQTKKQIVYDKLKAPLKIPLQDREASKKYPWIYFKPNHAISQGLRWGFMDTMPKKFPVFVKPSKNIGGMGYRAFQVKNHQQFQVTQRSPDAADLFWTELLNGLHHSIDIAVAQGKIKFSCCFLGTPGKQEGTFSCWESLPTYKLPKNIRGWIHQYAKKYTGMLNIETMGNKIIEIHARLGDFNYLDQITQKRSKHAPLMKSLVNLYQYGKWNYHSRIPKAYLIPIFLPRALARIVYFFNLDRSYGYVRSICKKQNIPLLQVDIINKKNPVGGDRLFLLGCTNKQAGLRAKKAIVRRLCTATALRATFFTALLVAYILGGTTQ